MFVSAALWWVSVALLCFFLLKLFCNHGFPAVTYPSVCDGPVWLERSHQLIFPSVSQPCFQEPLWELSVEPLVTCLTYLPETPSGTRRNLSSSSSGTKCLAVIDLTSVFTKATLKLVGADFLSPDPRFRALLAALSARLLLGCLCYVPTSGLLRFRVSQACPPDSDLLVNLGAATSTELTSSTPGQRSGTR